MCFKKECCLKVDEFHEFFFRFSRHTIQAKTIRGIFGSFRVSNQVLSRIILLILLNPWIWHPKREQNVFYLHSVHYQITVLCQLQ